MNRQFERARSGVRTVVHEMRREDITFLAASIAYHAFVSMLPILLLLTLVVSAFGSERFVATALELTKAFLPETGQRVVTGALSNATGSVSMSVVGVVVLLWGTSKIFRAMDAAFAEIYDTERDVSLLDQLRDALVVLLALAVAAGGAIVFGPLIRVPETVPLTGLLNGLVTILGLGVAFFPMYYVFPNTDVSVREVLPGVFVAAVGWVGLEWLFNLYVSLSNKPDLYGLVGTLVLLVTWLYVGGLVLLGGAAVNATLTGRDDNRRMQEHDKHRFGRQITGVDSFEGHLEELIVKARDADIPAEDVREVLRRRAEEVGASQDEAAFTSTESEAESERG